MNPKIEILKVQIKRLANKHKNRKSHKKKKKKGGGETLRYQQKLGYL